MPVSCKLVGRMGNQMFQIATTIAYSFDHGIPYFIPKHSQNERIWPSRFFNLVRSENKYSIPIMLLEKTHAYEKLPYKSEWSNRYILIDGYRQSEKYFSAHREKLTSLFQLPPIPCPGICSIHIRLGDYMTFKDKHPPISETYIRHAIQKIIFETRIRKFLIFSDDIALAHEMLNPIMDSFRGIDISFSLEEDDKTVMQIMAGCDHNIIANSSFSWWGAWLNPNPEKIIIAPKLWFGPGNANLTDIDLVPQNWIRL